MVLFCEDEVIKRAR